uniref:Putative secreted protein n=1 Tax=Ixodes ricinus TaxID=34613 RepID=A0A6B0UDJ3_IXORI
MAATIVLCAISVPCSTYFLCIGCPVIPLLRSASATSILCCVLAGKNIQSSWKQGPHYGCSDVVGTHEPTRQASRRCLVPPRFRRWIPQPWPQPYMR